MKSFFISIPHSGERIPDEVTWLAQLKEPVLMCDVDRYVDELYTPAIKNLGIPAVVAEWHRYVVDLNRWPTDIDADSVENNTNPSGTHPKGLHWSVTTQGHKLIKKPMSHELHSELVEKFFYPFHEQVKRQFAYFESCGAKEVYHLDAHSMPSVGTQLHRDPGEQRAEIVVSDVNGKSCPTDFKDLVIRAYEKAGFEVGYNWPYIGGRVTETYGKPEMGHYSIQVELNRRLYMNEESKKILPNESEKVKKQIEDAVKYIMMNLPDIQG